MRGKVHHGIQFSWDEDKIGNVMANERKSLMTAQMSQVFRAASDEVIHPYYFMTFFQQVVA